MDGGGGADATCLQIAFFITSFRGAGEPQNLVTFQEYNVEWDFGDENDKFSAWVTWYDHI